ncbi:unnamed protein product [Schistocephalus solidus]|uniref:Zinc finger, FYVE domain containing 16 n=1 Tax=Schistocephalus solidus TaxID=70667 RepID=A0A183T2X5_SCHSO|nr:unnamed protein product [Schistocephalus solidus]
MTDADEDNVIDTTKLDLHEESTFVANPLATGGCGFEEHGSMQSREIEKEGLEFGQPIYSDEQPNFRIPLTLALTPITEVSEFSVHSSFADPETAATVHSGSNTSGYPSATRADDMVSGGCSPTVSGPAAIPPLPPGFQSIQMPPLPSPLPSALPLSSVSSKSSSLNEFLRLEEAASASSSNSNLIATEERQLLEGQQDLSLDDMAFGMEDYSSSLVTSGSIDPLSLARLHSDEAVSELACSVPSLSAAPSIPDQRKNS